MSDHALQTLKEKCHVDHEAVGMQPLRSTNGVLFWSKAPGMCICLLQSGAHVLALLPCTGHCASSVRRAADVLQGEVRCEQPNASLYTFTGNLVLAPPLTPEEQTVPLSQASLLLRGSSLRNTKYVFGTVVFAGHESKVSHSFTVVYHANIQSHLLMLAAGLVKCLSCDMLKYSPRHRHMT